MFDFLLLLRPNVLLFHSTVLLCIPSIMCYIFSPILVEAIAALRIVLGQDYMVTGVALFLIFFRSCTYT